MNTAIIISDNSNIGNTNNYWVEGLSGQLYPKCTKGGDECSMVRLHPGPPITSSVASSLVLGTYTRARVHTYVGIATQLDSVPICG